MIIEKYDWQFDIDLQKTQLIYINRVDNIIDRTKQLPELASFLNELGIDTQKPDIYCN